MFLAILRNSCYYTRLVKQTYSAFSRRGPDNVTEELVAALLKPSSFEFKALFEVIHESLKARNAASGGEEMLRLRAYEKLQNLVQQGQVKKIGKKYKGVRKSLLLLARDLKEVRKNGTAFVPMKHSSVRSRTRSIRSD